MLNIKQVKIIALAAFGLILFGFIMPGESFSEEKKVKWVKVPHGLGSLMKFGKSRGDMVEELKEETENHRKINKAIDHEKLKVGDLADRIEKRYGPPVVIIPENDTNLKRWVYKPYDKTFFDKDKTYLYFDENERLLKWEVLKPAK